MMRIVILVENHGTDRCKGEHGLSFYIEYNNKKYLLDTGTTHLYADNAKILDIDLSDVDMAFLSHAHYDHSGGFNLFFENNNKAKVYIQESMKENCYHKSGDVVRYIGLPKGLLESYKDRFSLVCRDTCVDEGVWIIPHHMPNLEDCGQWAGMQRMENNGFWPDDFNHEQSVVFETDKGLVIFNSCCHSGADVVIKEVQDVFPNKQIYGILGGFHLKDLDMENDDERLQVEHLAYSLMNLNVEHIYTGHCTGDNAFETLSGILGTRLYAMETGMEIDI